MRQTRFILLTALGMELTGAALLALRFCGEEGLGKGIWYGVFHSVSAFCNAGFDLMGTKTPFSSLTEYGSDPLVNGTISLLILLGGLGFLSWYDLARSHFRWKGLRLQTKLILVVTAALLAVGFFFFFFYEFRLPAWQAMGEKERLQAAWFQAVTPRTAGFNTVDLTLLSEPAQLVVILLMLIGGSPGSTAGGFKTTTLAVLLLGVRAVFERREEGQSFCRRIPGQALRNASALALLYLGLFLAGGLLICCLDGVPLLSALFEAASAIGTVGLSLGITTQLCGVSRMILILLMYFGRVGGLTLLYAVAMGGTARPCQYPQERVTVG